jgi:ribulose-5-phosphate 4-epimerase/fuculose-1-phosphate aldolase
MIKAFMEPFCVSTTFKEADGFAEPGSMDLANIVARPFQQGEVICVLMEDHGVTVVGKDVYDAYYQYDMFEGYAKNIIFPMLLRHLPIACDTHC